MSVLETVHNIIFESSFTGPSFVLKKLANQCLIFALAVGRIKKNYYREISILVLIKCSWRHFESIARTLNALIDNNIIF